MTPRRRARPWKLPAAPCHVARQATLHPAPAVVTALAGKLAAEGYVVVPSAEVPRRAPGAPPPALVQIGGAWSSSRAGARCNVCGETWPRDPALEVACPVCKVRVGAWCKNPSGHKAMRLHAERDGAALAAGKLRVCPGPPAGAAAGRGPRDPHRIARGPDDPPRIATGARIRVIAGEHADRLGKVVDEVLIGGNTVLVLLDRIGRERAAKTADEIAGNLERVHQLQGPSGEVGDDCLVCGCLEADPYEACPGFPVHVLAREAGEPWHRGTCEACGSTNAGAGERCDGRRA